MTDALQKYASDPAVRQLLLVSGPDSSKGGNDPSQGGTASSEGEARLYVKDAGTWKEVLRCPAILGRGGLGKEREGDMKTPVGDFGILCAFGLKDNPGTSLEYIKADESLYCCGEEGPDYNRFVRRPCDGEHICDYVPEYNYGIFPDYNAGGVYPAGSAIFIHVRGARDYTAGCVALSEEIMERLLKELGPDARIIISPAR